MNFVPALERPTVAAICAADTMSMMVVYTPISVFEISRAINARAVTPMIAWAMFCTNMYEAPLATKIAPSISLIEACLIGSIEKPSEHWRQLSY